MIALYIFLGIILLISLLLLLKVTFSISWCNGLQISFSIGFYKKEFVLKSGTPNTQKKESRKNPKNIKKKEEKKIDFHSVFSIIKDTLKVLYEKTKKHIRLDRFILKINVASDDPAKTGILYGAVSGAAASLAVFIDSLPNVSKKQGMILTEVTPDFISEKSEIFVDIKLSTRVWRALSIIITIYKAYEMIYDKK